MIAWLVAMALYVIGACGFYAMACDVNGGPIRSRWKQAAFLAWPVVVLVQGFGDLWDAASGNRPNWLRRQ